MVASYDDYLKAVNEINSSYDSLYKTSGYTEDISEYESLMDGWEEPDDFGEDDDFFVESYNDDRY